MHFVQILIWLYIAVLWLRALLSWMPPSSLRGPVASIEHVCRMLTEPLLVPLRRVLPHPRVGEVVIDSSVIVLMLILIVINSLL